MVISKQARKLHTHFRNVVPLVWGLLRLAPIMLSGWLSILCIMLTPISYHMIAKKSGPVPLSEVGQSTTLLSLLLVLPTVEYSGPWQCFLFLIIYSYFIGAYALYLFIQANYNIWQLAVTFIVGDDNHDKAAGHTLWSIYSSTCCVLHKTLHHKLHIHTRTHWQKSVSMGHYVSLHYVNFITTLTWLWKLKTLNGWI